MLHLHNGPVTICHLRDGGGRGGEDFWGGSHGFQGERWGISRHQQSIKGGTVEHLTAS